MSSVLPVQVICGQFIVSFFPIPWRWLLIGVWPVHSWVSMLVRLQLSELIICSMGVRVNMRHSFESWCFLPPFLCQLLDICIA